MRVFDFFKVNAPWLSAGVLLTFASSFGQTYFISIFAGVIRQDFGLSHGQWGGIYTIGTLASAVVMVWAGVLTDIFRVRALGIFVLSALAAACIFLISIKSVWLLPVAIFFLRFTGQGMTSHIATVAMARWFVAARGRALSIAALGFAFGEAFLPIAFVSLMTFVSWRWLWVGAAAFSILAIPILLRLLRAERTPQSIARETQSTGMHGLQWTRNAVMKHWLFWAMVPTLIGPSAFGTAFFFQQVHFAATKGWSHVELVALFPIFTLSATISMLMSGLAIDRFGTARLMPTFQIPMALGFVVLSYAQTLPGAAVGIVLLGLTVGVNSTLPGAFWAEFYGTRNLGSIKAMATAIMVLGSAIGPGITGYLIDFGIDFKDQMIGIAIYFIAASVLVTPFIGRAKHSLSLAS